MRENTSRKRHLRELVLDFLALDNAASLLAPVAKASSKALPESQVSFPSVKAELLRIKEGVLGNTDLPEAASMLLAMTKKIDACREVVRELDGAVPPSSLRRHLEGRVGDDPDVIRRLLPYYLRLPVVTPEQRDKVDYLIGRVATRHDESGEIVFRDDAAIDSTIALCLRNIPPGEPREDGEKAKERIGRLNQTIASTESLDDLIGSGIPRQVRNLKRDLGTTFFSPPVLILIAHLNASLSRKFYDFLQAEFKEALTDHDDRRRFEREILLKLGEGGDIKKEVARARESAEIMRVLCQEATPAEKTQTEPQRADKPLGALDVSLETYLDLVSYSLTDGGARSASTHSLTIPYGPEVQLQRWEIASFVGEEALSRRSQTVREAVAAWLLGVSQQSYLASGTPTKGLLEQVAGVLDMSSEKRLALERIVDAEMVRGNMFLARKLTLTKAKLDRSLEVLDATFQAAGGGSRFAARHPRAAKAARVAVDVSRRAAIAALVLTPIWLLLLVRAYVLVTPTPQFDTKALSSVTPILDARQADDTFIGTVGDSWRSRPAPERKAAVEALLMKLEPRGVHRIVLNDPFDKCVAKGGDSGVTLY